MPQLIIPNHWLNQEETGSLQGGTGNSFVTNHNGNHGHHGDTDQRTSGRGLREIHPEDREMRSCTARGALQGPYVLWHGRIPKMPRQIRQAVQSALPAEPMQTHHFGRGKDAGVWVAPGPRDCSCLTDFAPGLGWQLQKYSTTLLFFAGFVAQSQHLAGLRGNHRLTVSNVGRKKEKPQLKQLLPSASQTPWVETKASCFPCSHWLRGQPPYILLTLSTEELLRNLGWSWWKSKKKTP